MAQCMAMGQAAGTAAALCVTQNRQPRDLNVQLLQDKLRESKAILETPRDDKIQ